MAPPLADLTAQAQTLTSAGDLRGARAVLDHALDPRDTDPQHATPDLAVAAALHARILIALGDPHAARIWAAFAHAAEERLHGPHDERTLAAAAVHAAVLARIGNHGRAAQLYHDLVRELIAREGPASARVLAAEADLATAEHAAGHCTAARDRLGRAWTKHREVYGDASAAGIKMLARLGAMERECGRNADAREHLALARELSTRHLPAGHPLVAQVTALIRAPATGRHVCGRVQQSAGPRDHPAPGVTPVPLRGVTPSTPPHAGPPDTAPSPHLAQPGQAHPPDQPPAAGPSYPDQPGGTGSYYPDQAGAAGPPYPDQPGAAGPQLADQPGSPSGPLLAPQPLIDEPPPQPGHPDAAGLRKVDRPGAAEPREADRPDADLPGAAGPREADRPGVGQRPPADLWPDAQTLDPSSQDPAVPGRPAGEMPPPDDRTTDPTGAIYQQPLYLSEVHQAPGDLTGRHARADTPPPLPGRRAPEYTPDGRRVPVGTAPVGPVDQPAQQDRRLPVHVPRSEPSSRRPFVLAAVGVAAVGVAAAVVAVTLPRGADETAAPVSSAPAAASSPAASAPPAAAADAPANLVLRDNRDSVTLTWTYPKGSEGPVLISGGRAGQDRRAFQQLPAGSADYVVYGLNEQLNYCFTVAVVHSTDDVATSAPICTAR